MKDEELKEWLKVCDGSKSRVFYMDKVAFRNISVDLLTLREENERLKFVTHTVEGKIYSHNHPECDACRDINHQLSELTSLSWLKEQEIKRLKEELERRKSTSMMGLVVSEQLTEAAKELRTRLEKAELVVEASKKYVAWSEALPKIGSWVIPQEYLDLEEALKAYEEGK